MQIIKSLDELNIEAQTAIALGKFDGIHIGHMKLINSILAKRSEGLKSLVFTFDTSAVSFFSGRTIKEVTTLKEKEYIFEQLGIDYLVEYPLTKESSLVNPSDFIKDILCRGLGMKYMAAGEDVSFGAKGAGNAALLSSMADECGYELEIIDKLKYGDREVSSTYIREEIEMGHMEVVSELLGHPYSFAGVVARGKQLGRRFGMPTMNQYPDAEKILPPFGVYYSKILYKDKWYNGITNIGIRPTLEDGEHVSVESYLYDFDEEIYGQEIVTSLTGFKRPEMRFDSIDALKAQIGQDIEDGRKLI